LAPFQRRPNRGGYGFQPPPEPDPTETARAFIAEYNRQHPHGPISVRWGTEYAGPAFGGFIPNDADLAAQIDMAVRQAYFFGDGAMPLDLAQEIKDGRQARKRAPWEQPPIDMIEVRGVWMTPDDAEQTARDGNFSLR
jgi:hypothetical protein